MRSATANPAAVRPEVHSEADHGEIDGDISRIEDREVDRNKGQKIDHIAEPPAVQSIAKTAPQQEADSQPLPDRKPLLSPEPNQNGDDHHQTQQCKQRCMSSTWQRCQEHSRP